MLPSRFDDEILPDEVDDQYAPRPRTWFANPLDRLIAFIYLPVAFADFLSERAATAREHHRLPTPGVAQPSELGDGMLPHDVDDEYAPPPRTWFTDVLDRLIALLTLPATFAAFVSEWFASREYWRLWRAAPVLIASALVPVAWVATSDAFRSATRQRYEREYHRALEAEDLDQQDILLSTLVELDPEDLRYKYQLAVVRLEQGEVQTAHEIMHSIAPLDQPGFSLAHLWLAYDILEKYGPGDSEQSRQAIAHLNAALDRDGDIHEAHRLLGLTYASIGQWDLASAHLQSGVDESPELHLMLALAAFRLGDTELQHQHASEAETHFRQLVVRDPTDVPNRINWSETLRLQDNWRGADSVLRGGLAQTDDSRLRSALSKLFSSRAADAIATSADNLQYQRLLEEALRWDSENVAALRQIVSYVLQRGVPLSQPLLDTACGYLESAAASDNQDPAIRYQLGRLYQARGWMEKAIEHLTAAAELDSGFLVPLAQLLQAAGRPVHAKHVAEQAEEFLADRMAADGDDVAARLAMVDALIVLEEWDRADQVLTDGANADPMFQETRVRLLASRFDAAFADDPKDARLWKMLQQATEIDPANDAVLLRLAKLAREQDTNSGEAYGLLEKLLSEGTNRTLVHMILGSIAAEREDFHKARLHLDEAHRLAPTNPFVANNLAWTLLNLGQMNWDRALELADKAVAGLPTNPDMRKTRARILIKLQRREDALHDLEAALERAPDSSEIHGLLADVYKALGETSLADRHRNLATQVGASEGSDPDGRD